MGIKGTKQKTRETPTSLRETAKQLHDLARDLENIAEGMDMRGIRSVEVRHGPGTKAAISDTLRPFATDATKKAAQAKR